MNKLTNEKFQVQLQWACQEPYNILELSMAGTIQSPNDLLLLSQTLNRALTTYSGHELNIIYMLENLNTKLPLAHHVSVLRQIPHITKPGSSYFVGSPVLIQTMLRMVIQESVRTNRLQRQLYFVHCKEMALSQIAAAKNEPTYFYKHFGSPRLLR